MLINNIMKINYSGFMSHPIWFFYRQELVKPAKLLKNSSGVILETDKFRGSVSIIENVYFAFLYRYLFGFLFLYFSTTVISNFKTLFITYLAGSILAWVFFTGFSKKKIFTFVFLLLFSVAIFAVLRVPKDIVDIPRILAFLPNTTISFFLAYNLAFDIIAGNYKKLFVIKDLRIVFTVKKELKSHAVVIFLQGLILVSIFFVFKMLLMGKSFA